MALLIDGYNLLHVTGRFGRRTSLEASRQALLGFLSAAIGKDEASATTVVFDAAAAPPGLPNHYNIGGIDVHFARGYESADELLEELIAAHPTPRKLTVVSSDHRVQRAAKKRRAQAIDSDVWYRAAAAQLKGQRRKAKATDAKPPAPLTPAEVAAWLREFGDFAVEDPIASPAPARADPPAPRQQTAKRKATSPPAESEKSKKTLRKTYRRKPPDLGHGDVRNPFPPGYGEDDGLLADQ